MMFFDWLSCYQDFDFDLPIIADDGYCFIDFTAPEEDQLKTPRQNRIHHEGSYSTSIQVHVKGRRIVVSGNPSRFNRLDNLFGFQTIDQCLAVYNQILASLGLPLFTPCTKIGFIQKEQANGSIKLVPVANGVVLTTLHITSNISVGPGGCIDSYLKAISMLPYRHSVPRLHADGKTVDWLSKQGNARELYPSVYDKGHEMKFKTLPNIKRKYGEKSPEYQYIQQLQQYCESHGVARFEQKLNAPFLNRHNLQFYGLSDYSILETLHTDFLNLDHKMQVSSMNINTISETLINEGIVDNTRAANITALYALNWMNGQTFDPKKSQVQTHRARLRKIGIDILKPCNLLVFSPVIVKEVTEIHKQPLKAPDFYKHPNHLRLVA
ncbi:phage/plasmid replication domain-containing protein [Methylomonas methanica]|uniref:Uncharacterized protein n=1 Tax=Methylomonas methanica (strain DSM 25384 / MC09) TaxID=857087 RepID=F9ZVC8_METMM|nr:phage/plasmid replication protein [Methylomonas methanica]AEG00738.1 hypothetical protein Metme_2336 [Methylomonas methanica MC09]